jgi:DNA-binding IclR family transcriptional regulator
MTVKEAAQRLTVAPSTAHRLLQMLVFRDFAWQGSDRVYYAGPVLHTSEHAQSDASRLRAASEPHLRRLSDMTQEAASLGIRIADRARLVLAIDSPRPPRVGARDAMFFTAWRSTAGRLSLAELAPADVERLFPIGHSDPPDMAALDRDLTTIRAQGFALNKERADRGVVAVGVPLRGTDGAFLAGIATAVPPVRYEPSMLPRLVAGLRRTAKAIESDLG